MRKLIVFLTVTQLHQMGALLCSADEVVMDLLYRFQLLHYVLDSDVSSDTRVSEDDPREYAHSLLCDLLEVLINVVGCPPQPLSRFASPTQKPHQVRVLADKRGFPLPC